MAITYKILGQSAPADTNNANMITVGAGKSQVISTLVVANTSAASATCRVFARIAGATAAASNALLYDTTIAANTTANFTLGISLAATDILTVRSSVANALTFTAFGMEQS